MEEDEDYVVEELDVFLAKTLAKNLYVFQYPVRPSDLNYDDMTVLNAQIKPTQRKVELELGLNTHSSSYDRSKGQQIALNVDGHREADCYFNSDVMDKQVLTSTQAVTSTSQYAVGLLKNNEIHLTPVHGIVQLRPSFNYLDRSDAKQKQENKDLGEEDSSQDEGEEEAKAITVKFARPETDSSKKARQKSYHYLQQKNSEESWMKSSFHHFRSEESNLEAKLLMCSHPDETISELHLTSNEFLHMLIPDKNSTDFSKPSLSNSMLSMAHLRTLPLGDQIKTLMLNVKIIQFGQLLSLLSSDIDSMCILRGLQQVAMLVQGCWVVKSDVIYPKDSISPHSGVSADILCRGRDYIMWRFTQNRHIIRKEISAAVKLPPEDLKEILEQMAKQRMRKGWEFLLPYDADFVQRYPEVVERQKMLWDVRCVQLSKNIKPTKTNSPEKGVTEAASSPTKPPHRRRTKSQKEIGNLSGVNVLTEKDTQINAGVVHSNCITSVKLEAGTVGMPNSQDLQLSKDSIQSNNLPLTSMHDQDLPNSVKIKLEPMDTSDSLCDFQKHVTLANATDFLPSQDLQRELTSFVRDRLITRWCMTLSELKRALTLKLAESPPGHILSRGVSDLLIEKAAIAAGALSLQLQWPNGSHPEPLFALIQVGDHKDEWRKALVEIFQTNSRYRKSIIKKRIEEAVKYSLNESDFMQLLQDYCVRNKSGMYYLKGTLPSGS